MMAKDGGSAARALTLTTMAGVVTDALCAALSDRGYVAHGRAPRTFVPGPVPYIDGVVAHTGVL